MGGIFLELRSVGFFLKSKQAAWVRSLHYFLALSVVCPQFALTGQGLEQLLHPMSISRLSHFELEFKSGPVCSILVSLKVFGSEWKIA